MGVDAREFNWVERREGLREERGEQKNQKKIRKIKKIKKIKKNQKKIKHKNTKKHKGVCVFLIYTLCMTHVIGNSDTDPAIGQQVVVTTAGNKYVGSVRRMSYQPSTSITLDTAYNYQTKMIEGETYLRVEDPNDRWSYLSEESPPFQAEIKQAYAKYYQDAMEQIRGITRPFLRRTLLGAIPDEYKKPYQMEATMNQLSKSNNPFDNMPEAVKREYEFIPKQTPRAGSRRRSTRRKTKRKKTFRSF